MTKRAEYEPGDELMHPVTGTVFEVAEWTHAVIVRNVETGDTSAIPSAIAGLYERV